MTTVTALGYSLVLACATEASPSPTITVTIITSQVTKVVCTIQINECPLSTKENAYQVQSKVSTPAVTSCLN